jgi:V8-like Glu-specific endopeptidase
MEGLVIMGRQPLSFAVALAIVALAAAPVNAAPGASAEARAEHQRIVAFWTPARMKAAIPRQVERAAPARLPMAKPAKPGDGGTATVTGASWTKGGLVRKAVGKVFFDLSGTLYTCSGSVTEDTRSGYSLVLTAAHCAYDEAKDVFATKWMFIPDYETAPTRTCDKTKYGCWTAEALVVHEGWASEEGFTSKATQHDFAFAVVRPGGKSETDQLQLDETVGFFPIASDAVMTKDTPAYAFGYPAAGKYNGTKLIYCAGPVGFDAWNDEKTYSLGCDMTGGSSGGPWFHDFKEGDTGWSGTQISLNSYGYSRVKAMYGPMFGSPTQAVYDAADSAIDGGMDGGMIVGN